jgi:transcriptional regulator with XRE-family HTH domain
MKRTTKGILLPSLYDLRKEKNLTRRAISEAIGLEISTIYRLEKGITGASYQTAEDLAGYLGVSIEALKKNMHAIAL